MDGGLILETTFLVDLERERHREIRGPAHSFLESQAAERLYLTVTTAGELAAGLAAHERAAWDRLVGPFDMLLIDLEVCWEYGRVFRHLRDQGLLIGANDLWIAATAITNQLPLVTRNERHFNRVPGLQVIGYLPP